MLEETSEIERLLRLQILHEQLEQARAHMLTAKNVEAALAYCQAEAALTKARAALPKPRLVSTNDVPKANRPVRRTRRRQDDRAAVPDFGPRGSSG